MVVEPEFFVSDETGIVTGPLSATLLRAELQSRPSPQTKVRFASGSTWLPAYAVDPSGDHGQPPAPPPVPREGASATLPPAVVELTPKMREYLLWFVADADGIMGPVTGDFVRRGLATGKISPTASLCMASSQDWVRALTAFPKVIEGTTKIRTRPAVGVSCPFCLEPMLSGDPACGACGERVLARGVGRRVGLAALVVLASAALFAGAAVGAAYLRARSPWVRGRLAPTPVMASAAASSAQAPLALAPSGSASAAAPLATTSAVPEAPAGHLTGELAGKIDLSPDAVDVLPLSHHRIAVARKAVVDVLDEKSGAVAYTAADLPAIRALYPVGHAVYAVGEGRLAIVDAESFRVRRALTLGSPPGAITASDPSFTGGARFALAPLEAERAVAVIDAARGAEIERFRFDERVTAVSLDAEARVAVGATSDARGPRPFEDAVLIFDPRRPEVEQLVRRVQVGAGPVAVAVEPGAGAAAVALASGELVRIDLSSPSAGKPVGARQKTCAEPVFLRFAVGSGLLLVGCQGGRAVALHDAVSLAKVAQLDLGGPVIGLDVAPDGLQALAVGGMPLPSVAVIDLARKSASRLPIKDEIATARYGRAGTTAVAFSLRAHRAWVVR